MSDKEKIIKALECYERTDGEECKNCPYTDSDICVEEMSKDALTLLKEQEPRVLDWDEIKNYSVVWGEFRGVEDIYPLIITLDSKGRPLSWNPNINVSDEFLFIVYDEEDRKNTRCWNHEPSDEQRQAVKWE